MGEVYRRAIKAQPPGRDQSAARCLRADAERLVGFTREAQTPAALNHPKLVEGDDLSMIIARGPMPLADVPQSRAKSLMPLEAS